MSQYYFKLIFILKILCCIADSNEVSSKCNHKDIKDYLFKTTYINLNTTDVYFVDFKNYKDIILFRCKRFDTVNISNVYLIPKNPMLLGETLQLKELFVDNFFLNLYLMKINGFVFYNLQKKIEYTENPVFCCVTFKFSKLDIYLNWTSTPISKDQCDENTFHSLTSFLQPYPYLDFESIIYPKEGLCKLIFKNLKVQVLFFRKVTHSLLMTNRLIFIGKNVTRIESLVMLTIDMYHEGLTLSMLDVELFYKVEKLNIIGVDRIETGIFVNFKNIQLLAIFLLNVKNLFHSGTNWLEDLNSELNVNLYDKEDIIENIDKYMAIKILNVEEDNTFFSIYKYPNEDLCLFKDFPHSHLVVPILKPRESISCTCTVKWLQMYLEKYETYLTLTNNFKLFANEENVFTKICDTDSTECDFNNSFKKCDLSLEKHHHEITDKDLYYTIKWLQYVLLVALQPLFGIVGLIHNILILLTVKKIKKNIIKEPMYNYIHMNATFNILCCIVMNLSLVNTCINYNTHSVYCSSVYTDKWAQYFKIVVQHFIGNVFRTCMNVSYLFISLSRFISVSNLKEKKYFKNISHLNYKLFLFVLLVFAVLISLFKIFQYDVNTLYDMEEFPSEFYSEFRCLYDMYKSKCVLFDILKLINKSFNDIFFFLINIFLDFLMLKHFNKEIEHKMQLRNHNEDNSDLIKKKKNVNRMIIANSTIFFFSHAPEFLVSALLIFFRKKIKPFCTFQLSCDLINEEAQFFNSTSIVLNFYVFLTFDKNFRESFHCLIGKSKLNTKSETSH